MTKKITDNFFKLAETGGCVAVEAELGTGCQTFRLKRLPNIKRKVESMWGIYERDCAEVRTTRGRYIAVKNTGTLYQLDGECLASSFLRLLP